MLEKGQKAPNFKTVNQNGETVSLNQLKDKTVVLYFYPKDDTPGCTTEGIEFSQLKEDFEKSNAVVLGISRDTVEKHQKFIKKRDLTVDLLSDESGDVCEAYGTWGEKQFMGKKYMGITRSTFVIDGKGVLVEANYKVKAKGHAAAMLELVQSL